MALLLICCFLLQLICFAPSPVDAATTATHQDYFYLAGSHIDYSSALKDDGIGPNGIHTYTLSVNIYTTHTQRENSTDQRIAENGTYLVSDSGYYFIELWGGKGASGADTTANGGSAGGRGGDAGHIYAKVYLTKGQVLFYSLGGNGMPTANATFGGGANGDGGHHGASGGDTVGGGGGYSALFLYDENEFESKYGSLDVKSIDESDRLSKYVMIAGGGGGGGSGNGQGLFNSAATGTADGGSGGGFSSVQGSITGANVVEGTFFAGADGKSSGSSFAYVGKGGTNLPGKVPDTIITNVSGYQPNDWAGTQNKRVPGGAGGSGNLRGGGGGAGFAGGSGGVMTGTLIPNNVGGGGGGSSFLASSINGEAPVYQDISDVPTKYIQAENPSLTGGSFCITYLGEKDYSYYENITLDGKISRYFEVTNASSTAGEFDFSHYDDGRVLALTGASLLTDEGEIGGGFSFTVTFKPINGFAGGNNIPILSEDSNLLLHATNDQSETTNTKIVLGSECRYVNVPLSLSLITHSYRAGEPGETFEVVDFYTDKYANVRSDPSADVRFAYIESLGEYCVSERGLDEVLTGTVSPNRSTVYNVYFDVVVKDTGYALVGERAASTRVQSTATVDVMTSVSTELGKYAVTYTKTLEYDTASGQYTYSLHVSSGVSGTGEILPEEGINHHQSYSSSFDSFEHPVAVSGYYMIRLWAGEGGQGANSLLGTTGGKGGARGYVGAYVYLEKGQYLKGTIGHNGAKGTSYAGGAGGDYTYVQLLDENKQPIKYLAIAAGGGGGGGSFLWNKGDAGTSATQTNSTLDAGGLDAYTGGIGGNGTLVGGGSSGSAHANYTDEALGTLLDAGASETGPEAEALAAVIGEKGVHSMLEALNTYVFDESTGGGAFTLHFLSSQTATKEIIDSFDKVLSEYTIDTVISPYFEIVEVTGEALQFNESTQNTEYVALSNNSSLPNVDTETIGFVYAPAEKVAGESTAVTITNINPPIITETIAEGEHHHVHAHIDFTIHIVLVPAEGFMGGNDVPVISSATEFSHVQYADGDEGAASEPSISLLEQAVTDYANIGITYEPPVIEGHDHFISPGESVDKEALFTLTGDLPVVGSALGDDWRYDYVSVRDDFSAFFEGGDTLSPAETTTYSLIVGVKPKADPTKATVAEAANAVVARASATVFVGHEVLYQLDGLTTSDTPTGESYFAPYGEDYTATLTPAENLFLPTAITVKVGETVLSAGTHYTYDKASGTFTIFADAITDTVTVEAKAAKASYKVHFIFMRSPFNTNYGEITQTFEAGTSLDGAIFNTFAPNEYEGYDFLLSFGDGSTVAPAVMPENDLWVTGVYVAKNYKLTIHYVDDKDGTPLAPDYTATLAYGTEYSVSSPAIEGYLANSLTVSGTMGASDSELFVRYTRNEGMLTIVYLKEMPDGSKVELSTFSQKMNEGDDYSVATPSVLGYTPDVATVSGVMTANGRTVYVTYSPNSYRISFRDDEGGNAFDDAYVIFDRTYGYRSADGASYAYTALPTPLRAGYVFRGWYLHGVEVTEDTVVSEADAHVLEAEWEAILFDLTVRYLYSDGKDAASEAKTSLPFGAAYSFSSPSVYGFTADALTISGTMPAQSTVLIVRYDPNTLTLTIEYKSGVNTSECVAPTVTLTLSHGEEYSVASPSVEGYDTCSNDAVSGIADAPQTHSTLTVTVYYYVTAPTVSVTVTWGTLVFDLTERGAWDPETHLFGDDTFEPATEGTNTVTVENGEASSISVYAEYSFEAYEGYEDLRVYFTETNDALGERILQSELLATNTQSVAYVWVEGKLPPHLTVDSMTCGVCKVTIKGGAEE